MSQVDIDRVTKRFGAFTAVDDLSITIPSGSLFGLLGPNGAGKTTTIRMMLKIFYPDEGQILFDGRPLDEREKARMGYLPEERGLYKKMRVAEQLEYLGRLKGLDGPTARKRSREFLERLHLADWSRKKVEELSKGMAQKIQFAAALIHDPSFVVLDEPFSGLDPINAQLLLDWMDELHRRGVTIVFSTHQMETVERLCEQIALINRGRVLVEGKLAEVKKRFGLSKVRLQIEASNGYEPRVDGVVQAEQRSGVWEIELRDGDDGQRLLGEAMQHGRVVKFERVEPTLQELFVRLVREARSAAS